MSFFLIFFIWNVPSREWGDERRKLYALSGLTPRAVPSDLEYSSKYITTHDGVNLFTCSMRPTTEEPKAHVFFLHGYSDTVSWLLHDVMVRTAQSGYVVHGIDHRGHGQSDGRAVYIPDFSLIVSDALNWIKNVKAEEKQRLVSSGSAYQEDRKTRSVRSLSPRSSARASGDLKCFLYAESMGGAIGIRLVRKDPNLIDGAAFIAPMCKIADDVRLSQSVTAILRWLSKFFPTWPITPVPDIETKCFKDPMVYAEAIKNPIRWDNKPRLRTAVTLIDVANEIEANLDKVTIPFIVIHGSDDKVG